MKKEYELRQLSEEFYLKYSPGIFTEIEQNNEKPYLVLQEKIEGNIYAIPFRTNVKHKHCYKFQNSGRSTAFVSSLDYSKAVIVNDESFIGMKVTIDNKEYIELEKKYYFIINQFKAYLNEYIKYMTTEPSEFTVKK